MTASGGHYTLDVLHPNRELSDRPRPAWIRIDDELVSDVRPDDVFGGQEREDRQPYLLFYRRTSAWARDRRVDVQRWEGLSVRAELAFGWL